MHAEYDSQIIVCDTAHAVGDTLCGGQRAGWELPWIEAHHSFLSFMHAAAGGILHAGPSLALQILLIALILTIADHGASAKAGEAGEGLAVTITAATRQNAADEDPPLVSAIKTVFRASTALFCRTPSNAADREEHIATAGIRN
jgi:hypothetical protein